MIYPRSIPWEQIRRKISLFYFWSTILSCILCNFVTMRHSLHLYLKVRGDRTNWQSPFYCHVLFNTAGICEWILKVTRSEQIKAQPIAEH